MADQKTLYELRNFLEEARGRLADLRAMQRPGQPELADAVASHIADLQRLINPVQLEAPKPPDSGLAQLIGVGPTAATVPGDARLAASVETYDEAVTSERLLAIADLYYVYQHERMGVFRAVLKMQELFRAGHVRLSDGEGAMKLYQYDRKKVLRHAAKERMAAYSRVFGYTSASPPAGSKPNRPFHSLFTLFNNRVARFFRDKRISEVVRPTGRDLSFGSIAQVRRAGLDLRSNLKHASYGYVNVLKIEFMQLLEEAFDILRAADVRRLFGADNAWDALEEIQRRYLKEYDQNSQRNRMATVGSEVLRWLAYPHILTEGRQEFEDKLQAVGEFCEEWLTSAESLGTRAKATSSNVVRMPRQKVAG